MTAQKANAATWFASQPDQENPQQDIDARQEISEMNEEHCAILWGASILRLEQVACDRGHA
jgi:hypothetical protein